MILPISVTMKSDTWKTLPAGTARLHSGTTTNSASAATPMKPHARPVHSRGSDPAPAGTLNGTKAWP